MAAERRARAPRSPCSPPRRAALRTASRRTTQYCRPTDIHARPSARYLYMRLFFLLLLNFFPFSLHYTRVVFCLSVPTADAPNTRHRSLNLFAIPCRRRRRRYPVNVGSYRRHRVVVATASVHVFDVPVRSRTTVLARPSSLTGPLPLFPDEKTLRSSPPRPPRLGTYMSDVQEKRRVHFLLPIPPRRGSRVSNVDDRQHTRTVSINGRPRRTTRPCFRARTVSASAVPPSR